jgi:membrane dipeptidase
MGHIAVGHPNADQSLRQLFADTLVWDNHSCATLQPGHDEFMTQLRRHKAAGVDVVCLNVGFDGAPPENTFLLLADCRRWLHEHSKEYALVGSVEEIHQARRANKLAVCFDLEGGNCLYGRPSMVSLYYELGVRWMLFAYNRNNALAGGCQDTDQGLTDLGRQVLAEMERVGMVVCCSHISQRSAMDIMAVAKSPVIFSHSNPAAVWPHARNISDDAIRACARTGGVVGINGIGVFVGDNDASTRLIADHIDYVARLVGTEHVGIGLDYVFDQVDVQGFVKAHPDLYPPSKYPSGINMAEPERFPEIAAELLKRGYRELEVRNILGGNHLRIASQVWK